MASERVWSILENSIDGNSITAEELQYLTDWELNQDKTAIAWGLSPETAEPILAERLNWLQRFAPVLPELPLPPAPLSTYLPTLWRLWLPLTLALKQHQAAMARPLIQGLLGGQGTGKTTLTAILQRFLAEMGCRVGCLSIDDLYKTHAERLQLRQTDSRLIWRGPPGTHDVDLGIKTLQQVRQATHDTPIALPRFDKSLYAGDGDRTTPEVVQGIDILLFEGWFLGARPVDQSLLDSPPAPIDTAADRQFALDMNQRLADYLPLWALLDGLIVLIPHDYRLSQRWRQQAEQQMKSQGKDGMSDDTVAQFVEYFWKALHPELFILPMRYAREWVDLVIEISPTRQPTAIYVPE